MPASTALPCSLPSASRDNTNTARVLNLPFGVELVVLGGLVLAGIAVAQGYQAISGRCMVYTEYGWVVADCTSMPKLCCNA
jgi:hypothetical protein